MLKKIQHGIGSLVVTCSILFTSHSFASTNELPDLGASALTVLSIEKEKRLGEIIFAQLQGQQSVLQDPLINEYLNSLGNRLVAHASDVKFPFNFFAVQSPDINAFAFYGGNIGVHAGLIAAADTESQLASVLGHEIAHVTQRHLARRKQASEQQSTLTLAGIIGSILMAAVNPQAMMASLMATTASAQQSMINHTRSNEQEADNIGMNILYSSGFDPYAAAEFFGKLQEKQRYRTMLTPFLVTHPMPASRVTDAKLRAQQFEKKFYPDSVDFLLMKERVLSRYIHDKETVIDYYLDRVKKSRGNRQFAAKYGLAIAYLDDDQHQKAKHILQELNKLTRNNLYILDALADVHIGLKQEKAFIPDLAYAYQLRPNNSVVTLNYANVLISAKQHNKAINILEYYLLSKPDDYLATQLLRSAYKANENQFRYHVTSAELAALRADYRSAIKSTDKALSVVDDKNRAEISRLDALKFQYREKQKYIKNIKGA